MVIYIAIVLLSRILVWKMESSGEVPAHYQTKRKRKNLRLGAFKIVREFHFACITPSPRQHNLVPRQSFLVFTSPTEENESIQMSIWLPQLSGTFPRTLLSCSTHNTLVLIYDWGQRTAGITVTRDLRGHQNIHSLQIMKWVA